MYFNDTFEMSDLSVCPCICFPCLPPCAVFAETLVCLLVGNLSSLVTECAFPLEAKMKSIIARTDEATIETL